MSQICCAVLKITALKVYNKVVPFFSEVDSKVYYKEMHWSWVFAVVLFHSLVQVSWRAYIAGISMQKITLFIGCQG